MYPEGDIAPAKAKPLERFKKSFCTKINSQNVFWKRFTQNLIKNRHPFHFFNDFLNFLIIFLLG